MLCSVSPAHPPRRPHFLISPRIRELGERAQTLAEQEAELARLRSEADGANRRALEEAKLVAKETEAAANLAKLQIQTLEKTLAEKGV